MGPRTKRPAVRWLRPFGLVLVAGLLAACSGAAASPTPGATATPTAAPAATPSPSPTKGPATAQLTLSGDPAAAGITGPVSVQCDFPTVGGPIIILFEQASPDGLAVRVVLSPGTVSVRLASGSGKTYLDREFAGTGVTGFDAATGAQIDSSLSTAPYAGATGNLGTITSIKGGVDCGNQQPGTSTLTLTGATTQGQLNGATLNPVRVQCTISSANGNSVQVDGVTQVGSVPTLFIINGTTTGFTVAQEPQTGSVAFYVNKTPAAVTLSSGGVHISGDATEQNVAAGATAHTVTVSGDATCGVTAGS